MSRSACSGFGLWHDSDASKTGIAWSAHSVTYSGSPRDT